VTGHASGESRHATDAPAGLRTAVCLALAGVLVRLALVWALDLPARAQRFEYDEVARNLVEGRGLGLTVHQTWYRSFGNLPYVLLTAASYFASTRPATTLLVLQALLIVPTTLAAFGLARRLFGGRAGVLAAAGTALHPALLYFDTHKLHPLGFDTLLAVGGLQLALGLSPAVSRGRLLVTGVLHGVALLERATFLPLLPLALLRLRSGRALARASLVYLSLALLPTGLWLGRSVLVYGTPVLNPEAAEFLWRGNNPVASGTNFARGARLVPVFEAAPAQFRREVLACDEAGQRRAFRREALRFMREQPLDAARLYLRKLGAFLWFSEHAGRLYPPVLVRAYRIGYAALALAACAGLVALRRRPPESRRRGLALVLFFLSVGAIQSVFYVETRHRWAVEPLLVVLAAGALADLGGYALRRWRSHSKPATPTAVETLSERRPGSAIGIETSRSR
jgi:4-amino-4-deoxy-L-arabinose transferase-like glycosyltransferase